MRSPLLSAALLVGLLLAIALAAALLLRGTASSAPIESLPRDTELMIRAQDPAALWRAFARTRMAPGDDEETLEALGRLLAGALQRRGVALAPAPAELAGLFARETLLAQIPCGDAPPGTALVVPDGSGGATVAAIARRLVHDALGDRGDAAWSVRTHRRHEYLALRLPGADGGLDVIGVRGLAIVTTSGAVMRRMLDALDGVIQSIGADPAYRMTRDRLGRPGALSVYASGAWIARESDRRLGSEAARRAARLLGLQAVRGAGLAVEARQGLFRERLFVALGPDQRGLVADLLETPPREHPVSRRIPADLPFYVALTHAGLDAIYGRLPDLISGATGADRKKLRARLDGLGQFLAIDPGRDLFGAFGDEIVLGFGAPSPAEPPEAGAPGGALRGVPAVVEASLRNPAAIATLLGRIDGLARALDVYAPLDLEGRTITAYRFQTLAPLAPAYRLDGGRLLAATSPELLADALASGERRSSYADRRDLQAAADHLPARSQFVIFADTARLAALARRWIDRAAGAGFLTGSVRAGIGDLPARNDLPLTAAAGRLVEGGLLIDWVSPVSPSLLAAIASTSDEPAAVEAAPPPAEPQAPAAAVPAQVTAPAQAAPPGR